MSHDAEHQAAVKGQKLGGRNRAEASAKTPAVTVLQSKAQAGVRATMKKCESFQKGGSNLDRQRNAICTGVSGRALVEQGLSARAPQGRKRRVAEGLRATETAKAHCGGVLEARTLGVALQM